MKRQYDGIKIEIFTMEKTSVILNSQYGYGMYDNVEEDVFI